MKYNYLMTEQVVSAFKPSVYSTRKRDHRGRDGNLSQIFTTIYDFGDGK